MIKFLSILIAGTLLCTSPASAAQSTIAAIVNSDTILASELEARIKLFLLSVQMAYNAENIKQVKEQILKRMIMRS